MTTSQSIVAPPAAAPRRGEFLLEREIVVPRDLPRVFEFFSDPANLGRITPPDMRFEIVAASTPAIRVGTTLDYKLRVRGFPMRWRSLISEWNPPHSFADEQVRGPYRLWIHRHTFEDLGGGRTRCRDVVRYAVLGGALVNRFLVRPDLERIFDFRTRELARIFGVQARATPAPPIR